jgi:hypothetical protein
MALFQNMPEFETVPPPRNGYLRILVILARRQAYVASFNGGTECNLFIFDFLKIFEQFAGFIQGLLDWIGHATTLRLNNSHSKP